MERKLWVLTYPQLQSEITTLQKKLSDKEQECNILIAELNRLRRKEK